MSTKRQTLTVQIEVPDNRIIIMAARHLPDDWPVLDSQRLAAFADIRPEWRYVMAGEQASHAFRHGRRLMRGAVIDRW